MGSIGKMWFSSQYHFKLKNKVQWSPSNDVEGIVALATNEDVSE